MKPPGIGEAIGKGFEVFKANAVTLIIVCLLGYIIPFVGLPGALWVCLKAVRGQKPEIGDMFSVFGDLVNHIMVVILQMIGLVACCIGVWITMPLFFPGSLLVADKKMSWSQAKNECMAKIKPELISWIVLILVCMLVGGLVGPITMPIGLCAIAYAYDKTLGAGGAKA